MKVSFIVPVYNAEKYLDRCVQSILNLNSIDYELILVNDGSKDNSWSIIERYMLENKRVKGVSIENQGVSNARNTGIKVATGEVIIFVDADDYFNSKAENVLKKVLVDYDKDKLYFFNYNKIYSHGKIEQYVYPSLNNDLKEDIINLFIAKQHMNSCWCKIFNRKIINDNNIFFDKTMKIGEDACFVMDYLMCVNNLQYVDSAIYNYYINSTGAMKSAQIDTMLDEVKVYKACLKLIKHFNLNISKDCYINLHNEFLKKFFCYTKRQRTNKVFYDYYKLIKEFYKNPEVQNILRNCSTKGLSKKQSIMLLLMKSKLYFLFSLLLKI